MLIAYLTGSVSASWDASSSVDMDIAEGRASMTASARSVMKDEVHPKAGTLPQFSMPDSRANSLYSISISSSVSMCSLTKLVIKIGEKGKDSIWSNYNLQTKSKMHFTQASIGIKNDK